MTAVVWKLKKHITNVLQVTQGISKEALKVLQPCVLNAQFHEQIKPTQKLLCGGVGREG